MLAPELATTGNGERNQFRTPRWPLFVALVLLWACIAGLMALAIRATDGQLVYPLDDPYIHMAMAKNVALHGVWSVRPDEFTSSSSSIAWTAALALLFLTFGVHDLIPFAANVAIATLALIVVCRLIERRFPGAPSWFMAVFLSLFVLVTPLPTLVFAGQEHVLHILLTVVFVFLAADLIAADSGHVASRRLAGLALVACVLPLVRYEGLYAIMIAAGLLALRGRYRQAAALVAAGALPVISYAAISVSHGWFWAPNSVLLKGNLPDWRTFEGIRDLAGYSAYSALLRLPAVAFLVYAAVILGVIRVRDGFWHRTPLLAALFVPVALAHLQYSQPRAFWLFRYEAYVIGLGLTVLAAGLLESLPRLDPPRHRLLRRLAVLVLLVISPLPDRAARAMAVVPRATANIYQQQFQMGRFLREYYPGESVALNDIGAPSYLAGIKVLDLVGLASMDIARLKRTGRYTTWDIEDAAREQDVRIAIVYDSWFPGALPSAWERVGSWSIRDATVVGSDTVTFYATRPDEVPRLRRHLREFERVLPAGVTSAVR